MSAVTAARPARSATGVRHRIGLALMAASGFAALGYQVVWTQQAAVWLGHDAAAVLAVVAAFFGGLAVGAFVLGGRIARSARPAAGYAACELVVAAWACALAFAMAPVGDALLQAIGAQPSPSRHWAVAFGGTFVLLLPATAAMGATLPAMDRVLGGVRLAGLYAANTFGAVAGAVATAFWLVPAAGLARTAAACVALNLGCAALGWTLRQTAPAERPATRPGGSTAWVRLAATGALGIGYEVLVVRVLSEVAENTVYTFALLLAVYLLGSAGGAAAYPAWRRRAGGSDDLARDRLCAALAAACLLGTASLWGAETLKAAVLGALGPGFATALGAETAIAVAAFLPPTVLMGALFSHLATTARVAGLGAHRSLAVNTLGAAFAPLGFGVLLLPAVGPKFALLGIVAGYLLLVSPAGRRSPLALGSAAAALGLAVFAPPLAFVDVPAGGHVVSYREGALAAVSVVEDADGVRRLRIDNREQEGDSASRVADARQALLPLWLHPAPRRALFLGLGTGVTAGSAAEDASIEVDAVELLPEVVAASAEFRRDGGAPSRLRTIVADARRFVRLPGPRYDVVVADNFHPARSGSGALYTVEHFAAVKSRLADGGVFCQWLPLHQLDRASLRSIVAAFIAVYPDAAALLATNSLDTPVLGLVGRPDGTRFDAASVRRRVAAARRPDPPDDVGLPDELAVLGSFVAGPRALQRFAADARLNTDDRPVVAALAPRLVYAPDSAPRDRLIALLHTLGVAPGEIVDAPGEPATLSRWADYRTARDRFIEFGRDVRPTADVRRMLAQVEAPLLSVLRTSGDFRPAYDPLLRMAAALAASDAPAARALLARIEALQPARPEAGLLLRRLSAAP